MFDVSAVFTSYAGALPYRFLAMIVVMAVAGWGFPFFIRLLGDPGPKYDGRETMNPLRHLDWGGLLAGGIFRIGWVKPFNVRPEQMRGGVFGIVVAVLGTVLLVLLFAVLLNALAPMLLGALGGSLRGQYLVRSARTMSEMSVWLAVVNLIPLPPFLAGHVWSALWPMGWKWLSLRFWLPSLILLIAVASGLLTEWLMPLVNALREAMGLWIES